MESYKNLTVWKKSVDLVTHIYTLTKLFPKEELYGLTSQMRRTAVSIPSNIAEGRSKRSTKEYVRFINIASGSAAELETQLIIAENLGFTDKEKITSVMNELAEVGKMLHGLIASLEKKLTSL